MNTALLRRQLAYWLIRRGWPATLGLALIASAAAYYLLVLIPSITRHQELEQGIAATALRLRDTERHEATTPSEQLRAFHRSFPPGTAMPDWLGRIYALAKQHRLELDVGEYTLTPATAGRLDQFRIVFPVRGGYPQIRKFCAAALASVPALALDSLTLKREKVADGSVDARIVFRLYLEKAE